MVATTTRIACFGGIYSNYLALEAAATDAMSRGVDRMFCLGDLGAFGPHPDRVFPLLDQFSVECVQGNYDDSVGNDLDDCQCGYVDPRDNHFAQISYDYTLASTSTSNRTRLRQLPKEIRLDINDRNVLLCHGSPRQTNEFLWESTSSDHFLEKLCHEFEADIVLATHSGIKWHRPLANQKHFANVGVLGRPENDGTTRVWYALIDIRAENEIDIEFIPIEYDYRRLVREMNAEGLPTEFQETVFSGWWTTCLEILPCKERRQGKY